MKTICKTTVLLLFVLILGCGKDDNEVVVFETPKSDAKVMTSFTFNVSDNPALTDNIIASVTEASKTVSSSLPNGTEIIALTPIIEISAKATISPNGAQDFRSPVTYTVTAEDGSTAAYRVSLMIMASDAKQMVSFVFSAGVNDSLNEDIAGVINEDERTILIEVPFGTALTALAPSIVIPENASLDRTDAQNFSEPLIYTVTAEDDSTIAYTVLVTVLERENNAPLNFELITPTANGANAFITVTPTLSWNTSIDPDGDTVTYDLFLNKGDTADQIYAENLTDTKFEITERLSFLQDYVWRIVAKDSLGAMTNSTTATFNTRNLVFNDRPVNSDAEFKARLSHESVTFNDKIWVIGGRDRNGDRLSDVWSSADGKFWESTTTLAPFLSRSGHSVTVFDNKMWLIAGQDKNGVDKNDVWSSEDGITWSEVNSATPFTGRFGHSSVVYNNKLWIIGGFDENGDRQNDVWSSPDGIVWNQETSQAPFAGRGNHTSLVFDNKIWVIGGNRNDVWFSQDGVNWSEATNSASFTSRSGHTSVVFDDKMWIIGGIDVQDEKKNDVWFSEDGITWEEITNDVPFPGRMFHTSVMFKNKIWVIGGNSNLDGGFGNGEELNDVWSFD